MNPVGREPAISVIMGIHEERYPGAIERAVDSILSQSFRDLELILYDDGSKAETAHKIMALADKDPRIVLLTGEENRGLGYSLNQCLQRARGRYIARMDADDISLPGRLEREYEYLETHPETGWVGTWARVYDKAGEWGETARPREPKLRDYLRYSPYIHSSVMFRREIILSAGYDAAAETLRCEDYEMFLRLYRDGCRGENLAEPLLLYYADRNRYHKRTWRNRVDELRIRVRNYRQMGVLLPFGWIECLRPLAGAFVPTGLLKRYKIRKGQL